jgi:hypothetical protein
MSRDLTHLPCRWGQPEEEAEYTTYPPRSDQAKGFQERDEGTFIAERVETGQDSINTDTARENSSNEPSPIEVIMKAWDFFKKPEHINAIMAVFTALIFIATAAYAVIASCQWSAMRESNKINRESLESVQRAFVTFDRMQYHRFDNEMPARTRWAFSAAFADSGTTPAIQVMQFFAADDGGKQELTEDKFLGKKDDWASARTNVGTIGPKAPYVVGPIFRTDAFILGDVVLDWKHASNDFKPKKIDRNVFFWGWIIYRDVLPRTPLHVTEFCQELDGITATPQTKTVFLSFGNCSYHNCTDEYCGDYHQLINAVLGEQPSN